LIRNGERKRLRKERKLVKEDKEWGEETIKERKKISKRIKRKKNEESKEQTQSHPPSRRKKERNIII